MEENALGGSFENQYASHSIVDPLDSTGIMIKIWGAG